jgi:hypothetical protein
MLVLDGAVGGSYVQGGPGEAEEHRLDAVEFCRILSGRGQGAGRPSFRRFEHCVLGGTEQARFGVRSRNIRGTRSKQNVVPNVQSIEETLIDQGFYEVGGDGFEPPTPAL